MSIKTFKRKELKYIVTKEQYNTMFDTLLENMELDEYCKDTGSYMIYNLYMDSDDDELIRKSISKPYYKEKLRMRSYKIPNFSNDSVFLEIKKKIGGTVSKRRATLSYGDAMGFMTEGVVPEVKNPHDIQVIEEISVMLERYTLYPKVFLSYERIAFFGKTDNSLRISFDKNIISRRDNVVLDSANTGEKIIEDDLMIMEIKCGDSMPLWLCHLLSSMQIYRSSFSKYGNEYKKYALHHMKKGA